jgi:hypothetical protein
MATPARFKHHQAPEQNCNNCALKQQTAANDGPKGVPGLQSGMKTDYELVVILTISII